MEQPQMFCFTFASQNYMNVLYYRGSSLHSYTSCHLHLYFALPLELNWLPLSDSLISILQFIMSIVVKLLTKPGCTLCQQSLFVLRKLKVHYPTVSFIRSDISQLPHYQPYSLDLPVVLINEEPVCRQKIKERAISDRIKQLQIS